MHEYVVRHALSQWCKMQGHYKEADAEAREVAGLEESLLTELARGAMPKKHRVVIERDEVYLHYAYEEE